MITKTGAELARLSKEAGVIGAGFNLARRGLGYLGNAIGTGLRRGAGATYRSGYKLLTNRGASPDTINAYKRISALGLSGLNRGLGYTGRNAGALGAGLGAGMYFGGGKGNAQQPVYRTY